MPGLPAIREALSWNIVAAFARRHPETDVHRSISPDGDDALVLQDGINQVARLDRGERARVGEESLAWERIVEIGVDATVELIESATNRPFLGKRPPTTPRVLTYRTISSFVNSAVFATNPTRQQDVEHLEVAPCHWATNLVDHSTAQWVNDFPEISRRISQRPCQHQIWHVKGRFVSIALDALSGEAWTSNGDHLYLPATYASTGRRFNDYMEIVEDSAQIVGTNGPSPAPDALELLRAQLTQRGIASPPIGVSPTEAIGIFEHGLGGDTHLRVGTTDVDVRGAGKGDLECVYGPLLQGHHFFVQVGQLTFLLASAGRVAVCTTHSLGVSGPNAVTSVDAVNRTWVRARTLLDAAGRESTERPSHLLMLGGDDQYGVIDLGVVRQTGGVSDTAYTRLQNEDDVFRCGADLLAGVIPELGLSADSAYKYASVAHDRTLDTGDLWGPRREHEESPFPYGFMQPAPYFHSRPFENPDLRSDLLRLVSTGTPLFAITFAGTGGTPFWICGARSRGRLVLETGYGDPGELRKPIWGGIGTLASLGWKAPVDAELGGFTAVLSERDSQGAVSLIIGTLQSGAFGDLHTIWWLWPPELADVVERAQARRQQLEILRHSESRLAISGTSTSIQGSEVSAEMPGGATVDLGTVAWQERIGQIETVLSFFGEQFSIEVERHDGVTVYVQGQRLTGTSSIELEAVSNEFLPESAQLDSSQIGTMEQLGWEPPEPPDEPNFRLTIYDASDDTVHTLAGVIGASLARAYGVQPGDEWTVSPSEFGTTVGDIVDPEIFDIFSEGPWFNWAWKSASSYLRLPQAAHEVLLFVLTEAKDQARSGPYRDGTIDVLGFANVSGANVMNSKGVVVARVTDSVVSLRLPDEWAVTHLPSVPPQVAFTTVGSGHVFGAPDPGFTQVDFQLPEPSDSSTVSAWVLVVRYLTVNAVLGTGPLA